jgi:rhodanese-related sulfurtransferase
VRRLPFVVFAAAIAFSAMAAAPASVEPAAVLERLAWGDRSLVLLDVRTPAEFAEGHLPGAVNIPHTEIAARIAELEKSKGQDIVVYCRSGNRSEQALGVLHKAGFERLFHLKGDYLGWSGEKRPVSVAQ